MGEPQRDQWGRYILPDPTTGANRSWVRATTVSGLLSDRYNLEKWANRMIILGLTKRPDLMALAAASGPDDRRRLDDIAKHAKDAAASDSKANIGTAIHAATEALDRGEPVNMPPPYDRDVQAYEDKLRGLSVTVVPGWIERIVLVPQLGEGVAGTLDRLVMCPDWDLPRIADIKTGATVKFSGLDHAVQQAIYANATHYYDDQTEELVPCPPIDKTKALIIHLPAGTATCEIHELDITAGWAAAQTAAEVRGWRARKDLSRKLG